MGSRRLVLRRSVRPDLRPRPDLPHRPARWASSSTASPASSSPSPNTSGRVDVPVVSSSVDWVSSSLACRSSRPGRGADFGRVWPTARHLGTWSAWFRRWQQRHSPTSSRNGSAGSPPSTPRTVSRSTSSLSWALGAIGISFCIGGSAVAASCRHRRRRLLPRGLGARSGPRVLRGTRYRPELDDPADPLRAGRLPRADTTCDADTRSGSAEPGTGGRSRERRPTLPTPSDRSPR